MSPFGKTFVEWFLGFKSFSSGTPEKIQKTPERATAFWSFLIVGPNCPAKLRLESLPPELPAAKAQTTSFWRVARDRYTLGKWDSAEYTLHTLDGRNRAIVIAESLARVITAIRIASVRWPSYLPPKHRN